MDEGSRMEFSKEFFYDEVQEGFYVPGIMKRAWAAGLETLSFIDQICNKWDISYFLGYGTLLGAIRHKGFIRWDDDIDIIMPREDYERFRHIVEDELSEEMFFVSIESDRDRCDFTAAICVKNSLFSPKNLRKYHEFPYAHAVDIFPLDELASHDEEEAFRRHILDIFISLISTLKKKKDNTRNFKNALRKTEELLRIQFDKDKALEGQFYEIMNKIFQEFNGEGGKEVVFFPSYLQEENYPFPKSVLKDTEWLPFCDTKLPVPKDYDTVLKSFYGDYTQKNKKGIAHDYSSFKKKDIILQDILKGKWKFNYSCLEDSFERVDVQSFREAALEAVDSFLSVEKNIILNCMERDFSVNLPKIAELQEEALALGNFIELKKGSEAESVLLIQQYCESLYYAYQAVENILANSKNTGMDKLSNVIALPKGMEKELKKTSRQLKKLKLALKKEFKKEVVFLTHRAKYFNSLRPLVDALLRTRDIECKIIPIPYYDRLGDGSFSEMHYEGEYFPKEYEIIDYRSYNFATELPDAIVINSPYDEYNQVYSVDPFFYSKNMKKFTNKLVYIPWFVTDEINPKDANDAKAFFNMNYYVNVPGIFHADLSIVQSKQMKKAYLDKISMCSNGDVRRRMSKKISGAGSCLFGDKEGQGTKELVREFRRFLSRK